VPGKDQVDRLENLHPFLDPEREGLEALFHPLDFSAERLPALGRVCNLRRRIDAVEVQQVLVASPPRPAKFLSGCY
jgi:hypothetical protein